MAKPDIEHVVVLMLENRSFDHMLGLAGVGSNGLLGADGKIDPAYSNTVTDGGKSTDYPATKGAAYTIPAEQIDKKGFGGPSHSFPGATSQLYGAKVAPDPLPKEAPMSGFAQSYLNQLRTDAQIKQPKPAQIGVPMQAFTPDQLPVLSTLAQEFGTCDHWFCEVPGPTQPNRLFVHAGTAGGFAHNVWQNDFSNPTIYEALEKVGRDWGVYYFDLRDTDSYPSIRKRAQVKPFESFYGQVSDGSLPAYSFLCPRFNEPQNPGDPPPNSQHAPYDVRNGENLIADVYEALRASQLWPKTALIITYDENGGYYDHVSPPTGVSNPDGLDSPTADDRAQAAKSKKNAYLLDPDYVFDFTRLGPRVPAVIVSPLIRRGTVLDKALQHTSILATLRDLFGVETLTRRDAEAQSFTEIFNLGAARGDAPRKLTRPPAAPAPTAATLAAPLTHQQVEMWPLLSHLDGHRDSGKVLPTPKTRGAAAAYIQERLAAHNTFHRARRRNSAYQVLRIKHDGFAWRLVDDQGHELARSSATYTTQAEAEAAIAAIRDVAPYAQQQTPQPLRARGRGVPPRALLLQDDAAAPAPPDAFDRLCTRLQQIDLFGTAGAVPPKGKALEQAIAAGGAQLPAVFQAAYLQPLQQALPRLGGSRGDPTTLETLAGAVYQHRSGQALAAPLGRFLAVISDLYRSFLDRDKRANIGLSLNETLPPLAMFQHAGDAGPFTIPVDQVQNLTGGSVGVVSMPATYAPHPLIWAALAHETGGHDVTHADPGLLPELAGGVAAAFSGLPVDPSVSRDDLASLWAYWIDEASADVYGLLNLGPAFAPNLAAFFVALNARGSGTPGLRSDSGYSQDDPNQLLDPHPTDILRLHLALGVVDVLNGLAAPARQAYLDQIQGLAAKLATADQVRIVGNIPIDASNSLQPLQLSVPLAYMQKAARAVGGYIAGARLQTLGGHGIQDIETWDDQDEARAQAVKLALLAGEGITGLGDDAQLLAGATLALLASPELYDAVTKALNAALDDSFNKDPVWGIPGADAVWIRYAVSAFR